MNIKLKSSDRIVMTLINDIRFNEIEQSKENLLDPPPPRQIQILILMRCV